MKKWRFIFLILGLGILQLTFLNVLRFANIKPDLLLIGALSAVFVFEFKFAFMICILCGLFKDAFLTSPLEVNSLLFALWGFLAFRLGKAISMDNPWMRVAVVGLVALLQNLAQGLTLANSGSAVPAGIFLRIVLISSIYTTLVSPFIFKLVNLTTDK